MRSKARRWVGIDGEGVGREPHRYVLLACSDGDYVESRRGLSTVECLDFILDLSTRDVRLCGYYLGYDWTMIVKDLPDKEIFMLYRPDLRARSNGTFSRVEYKPSKRSKKTYQLHWLAGAMWVSDDKGRKATVWDLGKYYQGPFIGALEDWKIRPDVQAEIAEMKKRRNLFTWSEISRIRRYCLNECEALADFASAVEQAHTDADLKPRGWFGPGSTASVMLRRHEIHEKRGVLPPPMVEGVACSFFGGRAEISRNGRVEGPIFSYDISSAYPYHASQLPCLEHGVWERVTRERDIKGAGVAGALVHGRIDTRPHAHPRVASWGPLPVRLPAGHKNKGSIVFPSSGASGWWWRDEWLTARSGWKGLHFEEAYVLRRNCDCKPFSFLPDLFARRREIGKESGEGKVLKLALNSCYGKLAQTIGGAQYASRVWAGMITSNTRAQVMKLMLQHHDLSNVLMIATDGLFSTEKHDLDTEIVLGGWERSEHPSITLVRPGIYWLGEKKLRARGLGRDSLKVAKVMLAKGLEDGVPRVELAKRVAFGGAKLCVNIAGKAGDLRRSQHYGTWHEIPTRVSLRAAPKRAPDWMPPTLNDVESAPYGSVTTAKKGELFEIFELIRDLMM